MKRRTVLLGGLQTGLALAMPWYVVDAQSATNAKFVVDFTYQGNHAIWGLALAQGIFSREGLNVTMDRGYGSGDTIVKVASGAYDIGFADVNAAVKFNAQNPDKRVIAVLQVFNRTLSSIITLKKSGIADPKQLPGHTVGAPEADASRLLFPAFAKKNGIDPSSVTWKSIAPNLRETILIQGQVDAISGFRLLRCSTSSLPGFGVKTSSSYPTRNTASIFTATLSSFVKIPCNRNPTWCAASLRRPSREQKPSSRILKPDFKRCTRAIRCSMSRSRATV